MGIRETQMRQPRLSVPDLDLDPDSLQEPQKGLNRRMIRCDLFWKDPSVAVWKTVWRVKRGRAEGGSQGCCCWVGEEEVPEEWR